MPSHLSYKSCSALPPPPWRWPRFLLAKRIHSSDPPIGLTLSLLALLFCLKLFVETSICLPSTRLKAPWGFVYWYMLSAYQRIEPTLINGCGRKRGSSFWLEDGRDLVEEVTWCMESHQEELGEARAFWGKITEQARLQFQKPFEWLQVGWLLCPLWAVGPLWLML